MRKSSIFSGLVLLLILGCFGLALADEVFTITTYYPSPYGSYNELQSNKLAIGDTNVDPFSPGFDPTDMPPENGSLWVARSVILKPQSIPLSNPTIGELAYDASTDKLSLYNGSAWVAQSSGGGGCYTNYGTAACAAGYTRVVSGFITQYGLAFSVSGSVANSSTLACSSISHTSNAHPATFYGTSSHGRLDNITNEPCAICCK